MKRILIYLLLSAIILSGFSGLTGCTTDNKSGKTEDGAYSVKSYKDIPEITQDEIDAIEKLKAGKDKFTYGAMLATEAYILPDGSYAGYTVEFCKLLSELFGIEFVLEIYGWDELMTKLDSKELDFTGELTPNEERMRQYIMSEPIAARMLRLFKHVNTENIKTDSDIDGLKMGFFKNSNTAESIGKRAYPITFDSVDADDYEHAARMIQTGEIDAFICEAVADVVFDEYDFIKSMIFFPIVHESVSMTSANQDYKPFISVLNKYIKSGGIHVLHNLYMEGEFEYSKYKLNNILTDEERAYISDITQNGKTVSVAYEHDNYPVNFYNDKENEFQGIAVDVLNEIGKLTGLKFEPATSKNTTWSEIYEKLLTGEIPMAGQLLISEEREGHFIWSKNPYATSFYALISKSEYPNLLSYEVVWTKVGAMKGSGKIDIYRVLFPENDNLIEYGTQNECLEALESGEIDLMMASDYNLLMQTNYHEKSGYKINILLNLSMDSYFGFHKNEAVLCSIISKAQEFVQTSEIEIDWTGRSFDYSKKLAEERSFYLSIFLIFMFCVLAAIIFIMIRSMKLSKELKIVASHDVLTGIFNRRYFMEQAGIQIARSLRLGKECFIIMYDLDHFKNVNDTYGHLAGDKVLREIAQRIKHTIRPYDLFGRYGGEEFIMLMCDADKDSVIKATERVREIVAVAPVEYNDKNIAITASFGIAPAAPKNDLTEAINCADEVLYVAKDTGRNKVVFYEG